jgi:hypothetical protein
MFDFEGHFVLRCAMCKMSFEQISRQIERKIRIDLCCELVLLVACFITKTSAENLVSLSLKVTERVRTCSKNTWHYVTFKIGQEGVHICTNMYKYMLKQSNERVHAT